LLHVLLKKSFYHSNLKLIIAIYINKILTSVN